MLNLFDDGDDDLRETDHTIEPPTNNTLAVPCGFRNRKNKPCQRRAFQTVVLDGRPLEHRGKLMIHCLKACFQDEQPPPDPTTCPF